MMFNRWGSSCVIAYTQYLCACVCATCLDPYILNGYTTLHRGKFSSPSLPDRELLPPGLKGPSQKPSQAFLMLLHWASWRRALFSRCSEKQRFIITHDLLSSASSIPSRHRIWKISVHALVRILVRVPELIMGNEYVLPTSSYKALLSCACIHY